jgi:putative ABC transport system permease protein
VTGDVKQNPHLSSPQPQIYVPRAQLPLQGDMSQTQAIMLTTYIVRTREEPTVVARAVRRAVAQADPAEAVTRIRTVSDYAADQLRDTRQYVVLLSVFGGVAILLAVTGIFGITAHSVSQRINEIGIRMALGAASGDVLRVVLARAMRLIALGLALGIAASLALTKAIQNLLWGVTSADPATFLTVTLLLAAVALLACYLPARRALRVDPVIALRYE